VSNPKDYSKTSVLVIGAGPAGLATAIRLKKRRPELEVCVLDKAAGGGQHNLSGAVMEAGPLHALLDEASPGWRESDPAKNILSRKVEQDQVLFFAGSTLAMSMMPMIKAAKLLKLGFGQMVHHGDYIVSISQLTKWLADIARQAGVEVWHGFAAEDIVLDSSGQSARGVKMVDQGLNKEGKPQVNYLPGETICADTIVLAEGCDGLLTEKFISGAGLRRQANPMFSVGVKEIIEVSAEQYAQFGDGRVVHAMGFPLWAPVIGPGMFGGGIMYSMGNNRIAAGVIVGADWADCDFIPQDALAVFKTHAFVKRYLDGGKVVEAGAKMIPEGGFYAIPRDPQTGAIGKGNVLIVGDSAGFVNMLKIKGLHNAIESGMLAGDAVAETVATPNRAAEVYTQKWEQANVAAEMRSARSFRQTVARFGATLGMPLSVVGNWLPMYKPEKDYQAMKPTHYKYKPSKPFDKDGFTALARVEHREEQPCHCHVRDENVCIHQCPSAFDRPCIKFCPAGVYELIHGQMKAANPSNCLHCKTCQNKCPYDNLRWTCPEGGGGPRYQNM
jgi:electron-transferring-flavoprotein dehydrogenase